MARYKYGDFLDRSDSDAYDTVHQPGATVSKAGIYRCTVCGSEVGVAKGQGLPPETDHQHKSGQDAIQWKLLVFARGRKK